MIAALLTAALAGPSIDATTDGPWHVRLDTSATWGIGGQMFLGADVAAHAERAMWTRGRTTGTVDVGGVVDYGNEATFLAPWIDRDTTTGATHRVQVMGLFGTTFHGGPDHRVAFGVHVLAGVNHWRSAYRVDAPDVGLDDDAVVARTLPVVAARLTLAGRVSERVGLQLWVSAPLPTSSSYAIGLGSLGFGPTFYLR